MAALERVVRELGFEKGEHLGLAYEIQEVMSRKYGEKINSAGYRSGFLSDQGFTASEVYRIMSIIVNAGITPCYIDTFDSPPESFFPLRCEDTDYQGEPPRQVPDMK